LSLGLYDLKFRGAMRRGITCRSQWNRSQRFVILSEAKDPLQRLIASDLRDLAVSRFASKST
jgi:hypothetical protein